MDGWRNDWTLFFFFFLVGEEKPNGNKIFALQESLFGSRIISRLRYLFSARSRAHTNFYLLSVQ